MIDLSELFEKVKHAANPLTTLSGNEHAAVKCAIMNDDAHLETRTDIAIRIFTLTQKDTDENIEVVERFLRKDADSSAKSAALIGLTRYWLIKSRYDTVLAEYILADEIELDEDADFICVAIGIATVAIFRDDNVYLKKVIRKKLSNFLQKYVSGLKYYEDSNFRLICSDIVMNYSRYKLNDYTYLSLTLEESVEVAENIDDYFSQKIKKIKYE